MDFISIISAVSEWAVFAFLVGLGGIALILSGYLFYRKKLHGKHRISWSRFVVLFLLLGWFLVVLGLTTLSRGANFTDQFNFNMFSGYVNAWNKWSLSELQLILFNMIMFLPLGFLFPLLTKKAERFHVLLSVSFTATIGIEIIQLLTSTGIFELDDLFHNMLGSIMGYAVIMAIIHCLREKKLLWRPIGRALAIPLSICLILACVFTVYQMKGLGNMPILPGAKQDMRDIVVTSEIPLSDREGAAALYRNRSVNDLEKGEDIVKMISSKFGLDISGPVRIDGTNRIFTLKDQAGNPYHFNYFMHDGTWNVYSETQETAASYDRLLSRRDDIETWMIENGMLQENAKFKVQNRTILRWDMEQPDDIDSRKTDYYDGFAMITLSEDNIPLDFMNTIGEKEYIRTVEIISPRKAFGCVVEGEFEIYSPLKKGDKIIVSAYELSYRYDTKGYYQPGYLFSGYINNTEHPWSCFIPAIS